MQYNYTPVYMTDSLICGTGQVALIIGRTPLSEIKDLLDPSDYCVISNLYPSDRALNCLTRNLLANPHVRFAVILATSNEDERSQSCQCFVDFIKNGFHLGNDDLGRDCWVVNSDIRGFLDIEISKSALNHLRNSLVIHQTDNIKDCIGMIKIIGWDSKSPWGKPVTFPLPQSTSKPVSRSTIGQLVRGDNIVEAWVKLIHCVRSNGAIVPSAQGLPKQELIDAMSVISPSPGLMPVNLPITSKDIEQRITYMTSDSKTDTVTEYSYGGRLRSWFKIDQIKWAADRLSIEPDSTQVVLNLWDVVMDCSIGIPPCLSHIWLRLIDNKLILTATFRSHDIYLEWLLDVFALRSLQSDIATAINLDDSRKVECGELVIVSQSAHIYQDCFAVVDKLVSNRSSLYPGFD